MGNELLAVTNAGRTPHGYTLAIWTAATLTAHRHGLPGFGEVLAFTLAATTSFAALRRAAVHRTGLQRPHGVITSASKWASAVKSAHVVALTLTAVVSEVVSSTVEAPWCWAVTGSLATCVFVVTHAGQDALLAHVERRHRRRQTVKSSAAAKKCKTYARPHA